MTKLDAQSVIAELNTVTTLAHAEHYNAALYLALDAATSKFEHVRFQYVDRVRVTALLEAHAACMQSATRGVYACDTVAMLSVAEVVGRLANTAARLATNPARVLEVRYVAQVVALRDEVGKAGAYIAHPFSTHAALVRAGVRS